MEQHMVDLEMVLNVLCSNNLKISLAKCIFAVNNLDFLGCNISQNGIKPTCSKSKELNDFPAPKESRSLRRFLGMVGFYRKLIPNFASIVYPLTEKIRLEPKAKSLELNELESKAFSDIKNALVNLASLSPQS